MKRLILITLLTLPLAAQTTINGGRVVGGVLDVSGGQIVVQRGTGVPASAGCDTAAEVGKVYARSDAQTTNATHYVCSQTGVGTYAWELTQAGGGGAPSGAAYVTMSLDGGLSAERVLTAGTGITLADTGANGTATLANSGLLKPHTKRWAIVMPSGVTGQTNLGDSPSTSGAWSNVVPDSNNGQLSNYASAATTDSNAGWYGGVSWRTGRNFYGAWQVKQGETTVKRVWIGLSTGNSTTVMSSDSPSVHMAAFRYSTNASDTNWQCVTNNAGTPTVSDSTVAPSTGATQLLEILDQGSQIVFKIDGTIRCTINTTLPGSGQNLTQYVLSRTLENVAKNLAYGTAYVEADK